MRTTLDMPDETFRKLKAGAALRGFKLKEMVTQFIESGLAASTRQPASDRSRRRPPILIAREADGSVTPPLTNAQLNAILEEDHLAQYQRVLRQSKPRK